MKERLSGQIDLNKLFDTRSAPLPLATLAWRGEDIACDDSAVCVMIGSPSLHSAGDSLTTRQPTSAALLLAAWQRSGRAMVDQLGGSYALAIIDNSRRCVLIAVDRFAVETMCYRHEAGILTFADRADCVPGRGNDIDAQAIYDYLYFHMIPAPRTIFRQVQRLPAAYSLYVDAHGAQLQRHWPLRFDDRHRQSFSDARETFRHLIRDSVNEQIGDHTRVGAFLSGGTDSSTVAGMLCQITGRAAPVYSIGFDAQGYDEMEYARIAARHFGCEHHEYYVTPADLVASLPAVAQHHDQPFGNSSALPAYYCAKLARADGCSKMLAGDGGDELFGGNSRYATQKLFNYYQSVPQGLRQMIEPLCGDGSSLRRIPVLKQATGYVRHSRIPMPDRMQSFNLIVQLDPVQVLAPELLRQIDLQEPRRHMRATWEECQAASLLNRMLAYDWRYTLADSDLPKVRGATQMAGIQVAYPLLSDAITDFSMRLSPDWKLKRMKLRWFFKEALRGFLPDEIITKKKKGFGLPFGVWASRDPALKALAEESLQQLAQRGIVQADFANRLTRQYLPDHPAYYGEMVWILTVLELWLRAQTAVRLSI